MLVEVAVRPSLAGSRSRAVAVALGAGLGGGVAAEARAAGCELRVEGEPGAAWTAAVASARARVAGAGPDCREVRVAFAGAAPTVTLTTRDGRTATRPVLAPVELVPVVEALLVTLPPEPASERAPEPRAGAAPERWRGDEPDFSRPAPPPPAPRTRLVLGALAGGRTARPVANASLAFGAFAGVVHDRWEIALGGQIEPAYSQPVSVAEGTYGAHAATISFHLARRVALSDATDLLVGARAAGGVMRQRLHDEDEEPAYRSASALEARTGAFLGVSTPIAGMLRLRAEAGLDLVPSRISDQTEPAYEVPPFPSWGAGLMLGVEVAP